MTKITNSKGVPVGGYGLQSIPARALNPSFSEITVPDTVAQFVSDFWRDEIIQNILAATAEPPRAELPSPLQVVDRIRTDVQDKVRSLLDSKNMGTDGPVALEQLRGEDGVFADIDALIHASFGSLPKAIEHYSEDITRHPVSILRGFSDELRATAESFAFERPVSLGESADRLERLCRFTNLVMDRSDVVPPLVRDRVLNGAAIDEY